VKPNVPLLRQTLAHIEAHPEDWNQGSWRCDTAACFAGHAALLAGATWAHRAEDGVDLENLADIDPEAYEAVCPPRAEGTVRVSTYAQQVLGIKLGDAARLFEATNELDDLRRIVDELCAEGGVAT
jgi:hypothetical protein